MEIRALIFVQLFNRRVIAMEDHTRELDMSFCSLDPSSILYLRETEGSSTKFPFFTQERSKSNEHGQPDRRRAYRPPPIDRSEFTSGTFLISVPWLQLELHAARERTTTCGACKISMMETETETFLFPFHACMRVRVRNHTRGAYRLSRVRDTRPFRG